MPTFLAHDAELHDTPLEPPANEIVEPDGSSEAASVSRAWALHGGLLSTLSARVGIDVGCAVAVLCVESGGAGFGADGRMIIRFENHVFRREWGSRTVDRYFRQATNRPWEGHLFRENETTPWTTFHGRQAMEWRVFEFARRKNATAAMRSISMGAPQIMGFNHRRLGYDSVEAMFERFNADVRFQIIGLFDFLTGGAADSQMLAALRARDFGRFASGYNGPGQAAIYGALIDRHCERFEALQQAPRGARSRATSSAPRSVAAPPTGSAGGATTRPERSYTVRAGDTLGAIAGRYGVPFAAIVVANAIANPDAIGVGQVLSIPEAAAPPPPPMPPEHQMPTDLAEEDPQATLRTYTVVAGDTLGVIARRMRVPMAVIVAINEIANPDRIRVGQVLRLPD